MLCLCGAILLVAASSVMEVYQDRAESDMEESLAQDIAEMLDTFEGSKAETLTLYGSRILPTPGHVLKVGSNVVSLEKGDVVRTAMTRCDSDFELWYGGSVTISKRCQSPKTSAIWRRVSVKTSISSVLL